jgi:hypothetical protein
MKHVMFFSGGVASYISAKRLISKHGKDNVILLFTDTKYEHEDLYRFIDETVEKLGAQYIAIADGRTPWEVFKDERYLGNSRIDPCSKILKREQAKKWVRAHCTPETHKLYLGYASDEGHRLERSKKFWAPYEVDSPIIGEKTLTKEAMLTECRMDGIEPPELYLLGFPHNNCGGFCIKAGHAHFLNLLKQLPEKYAECEQKEEELREMLGDVSILKDRRNKTHKTLTLKQLRQRNRQDCDFLDWGGCGCFGDTEE